MTGDVVFDGTQLRVLRFDHGHPNLMVTFDFRTIGKADFGKVNPSQGFAKHGFDQVMIKTRRNDWFINGDTAAMEAILGALTARYARVHMLGYSMGGYGALRFAAAVRADRIVVISPQISISPRVVPWEKRYLSEALGFDDDQGQVPPCPEAKGLILYDPLIRNDRRQAALVAQRFAGLESLALPMGGHPATGVLKDGGKGGVLQRIAMDVAPAKRARDLHRKLRRESPSYWTRLAQVAQARHPEFAATALARAESVTPAGDSG